MANSDSEAPGVVVNDRSGDAIVWTEGWPSFRVNGRWTTGEAAMRRFMPSTDALKDEWSIVDGEAADKVRAELASAPVAEEKPAAR